MARFYSKSVDVPVSKMIICLFIYLSLNRRLTCRGGEPKEQSRNPQPFKSRLDKFAKTGLNIDTMETHPFTLYLWS